MEKIQINIPKGYEIDNFDKTTGEITFKETCKHNIKQINTFEDACMVENLNPKTVIPDFSCFSEDDKKALELSPLL